MKIPGVYVDFKGDLTQLKADYKQATAEAKKAGTDISNALGNAVFPNTVTRSFDQLYKGLTKINRTAQLTDQNFQKVGVTLDTKLMRNVNLSETAFQDLHRRMLQNKATQQADKAFQSIARSAGLSTTEMIRLRLKMGDTQGALRDFSRVAQAHYKQIGLALAALSGTAIYAINQWVDAASDLNEAQSKFEVVFKGQSDIARTWAKTLVDSYAMSTREATEFLGSIQDLLVPMGMGSQQAGRLSFELTKLAADLGSFNNRQTADVMRDIQSALTGEYETVKKYGVVLSATTVQQKALSMGLAKTKDELTAADKAQAAYTIIVESSTAAIGDMQRTADQNANVTKRLNSEWEDFSATLGEKFLPVATGIKDVTADILDNLTNAMKGPTIDDQISQVQARIDELLMSQDQKEETLEKKRLGRVARLAAERERFMKRNAGPADTVSAQILENFQERQQALLKLSPIELELKIAREDLAYLQDFKTLKNMTAHQEKKAELVGFGVSQPGTKTKTYTDSELGKFAAAGKATSKDFWQLQYEDRYEVQSRVLDAEIEKENQMVEAALEAAAKMKDGWQSQYEDRYEVQSRALDAMADKEKTFFDGDMKNAISGWASNFSSTLTDMVWDADVSFGSIAESFGRMITQMAMQKIIVNPIMSKLGFSASAHGNVFSGPGISAYSNRIVDRPTIFPFASGIGLMGEDGAEAIMPLTRTKDGDLGVRAEGTGGGVSGGTTIINHYTINAIDVKSFDDRLKQHQGTINAGVAADMRRNGTMRNAIRSNL